jgi:hypothetical protein
MLRWKYEQNPRWTDEIWAGALTNSVRLVSSGDASSATGAWAYCPLSQSPEEEDSGNGCERQVCSNTGGLLAIVMPLARLPSGTGSEPD